MIDPQGFDFLFANCFWISITNSISCLSKNRIHEKWSSEFSASNVVNVPLFSWNKIFPARNWCRCRSSGKCTLNLIARRSQWASRWNSGELLLFSFNFQLRPVPKLVTKHFYKIHWLPYAECKTRLRYSRSPITTDHGTWSQSLNDVLISKIGSKTISRKRWIKTWSNRMYSEKFALDGLKMNDQSRNHGITKPILYEPNYDNKKIK